MADLTSDTSVYSSIFDSNADGVVLLSQDQNILYWNPRMEAIFGVHAGLAVGKQVGDVLSFKEKSSFNEKISDSLLKKDSASDILFTKSVKSAEKCAISFSPIISTDPTSNHCLLIVRPVISRERSSGMKELIRQSPLAMSLYTNDGHVAYMNKAFAELWDVPFSATENKNNAYNIFEDEQLNEGEVSVMIRKAFQGSIVELPVFPYDSSSNLPKNEAKNGLTHYLNGYLFPMGHGQHEDGSVLLILQVLENQDEPTSPAVHVNEHKLKALALGVPGVIYEYHIPFDDHPPHFNYVSLQIRNIFGITQEEVTQDANAIFDLVHPADRKDLFATLNKTDQVDQYWVWSGRFIIDGKVKWIEAKSSPGIITTDRIIRYGLMMDITARKSIEDAHQRTEERLRVALEAADLGFWEWDVVESRKIFNASWAIRFGYSEDEAEAYFDNWEALIHPKDLSGVKKKLNRYLKKKTDLYEAEYRFKMADGSYRWVHDRGSGIAMDQEGSIIRATGTFVDIHEKKISEHHIQRQEQLFSHLFTNAPVGIVFLDENMVVRQINPGFTDLFGYEEADLVDNKLDIKIVPEDLLEESELINQSTQKGRSQKLETYRLNKDNEPIPVIIYSIPVRYQSQTIGIYGLYVDITDRVKVEKELEVRNLELDNFVYKVSHDLRAPLSSIMGLVRLVNQEKGSDSVYDYIDMIENRIKQLDHFISDILSHSKNLKLDVRYSKIDFREIIEDCFNSISYLPQTSKIKKTITIEGGDFYSDQWRISEILRNLISNAVKYYSPRRDEPFIEIDIVIDTTYSSIYFADNGMGITEDRLPKVFEMFYRATELGEGSGIGLYIVKNAIERLGGVIRVKSEANKGTSFEITLPNAIRELDEANTA